MWFKRLIIYKWNPLVLCGFSLWLAHRLHLHELTPLSLIIVALALTKLYGLYSDKPAPKLIGLVGMNMTWTVIGFVMYRYPYLIPLKATYMLPVAIILLGVGISIQERFDE